MFQAKIATSTAQYIAKGADKFPVARAYQKILAI